MRPEFKKEWLIDEPTARIPGLRSFMRRNERNILGKDMPPKGVIKLGGKTYLFTRQTRCTDYWTIWIVGPGGYSEQNEHYCAADGVTYKIYDLGVDESNELGVVAP